MGIRFLGVGVFRSYLIDKDLGIMFDPSYLP